MRGISFLALSAVFLVTSVWLVLGGSLTGLALRDQDKLLIMLGAGVGTGAFYVAALQRWFSDQDEVPPHLRRSAGSARLTQIATPLAAIAIFGAILLLREPTIAVARDRAVAALIVLLGAAALIALIALLAELASGRGLEVESHWGGLGGSLGGWSISAPVVALLIVLACLGGMVALVAPMADEKGEKSEAVATPAPGPSPAPSPDPSPSPSASPSPAASPSASPAPAATTAGPSSQ